MSDENESETTDQDGNVVDDSDFESMLDEHLNGGSSDDDLESDADEPSDDDSEPGADDDQESDDDADDDGSEAERKARPERNHRIVQRLQASEARVVELERALREVKASAKDVTQGGSFKPSGDILDDLINLTKAQLKVTDDNDPKLRDALWQLGGDMLAELSADSDDPTVRSRLERRQAQRRERAIQAQIDELKRGTEEANRAAQQAHGLSQMTRHLTDIKAEKAYPYLFAAEDDVPSIVLEGIATLVEAGHRVDDSNVEDTITYVLSRIDGEHKAKLSRLEKLRGTGTERRTLHTQGQQKARKTETHGAQKIGQADRKERKGGRTITASGVGQRVAKRSDDDGLTGDDLFERMLKEEQAARSRRPRR